MASIEDLRLDAGAPGEAVTARVHRPEGTPAPQAVLLAHGAGSDLDAKALVALAKALAERGHIVVRTNLPYRERRGATPKAEQSVPGYRALFADAARRVGPDRRWVAGGRSYGGRVASLAAAGGMAAAGLLLVSYPLHPEGALSKPRTEHWPRIAIPCLFVRGTLDPMCDAALFATALPALARATDLPVPGGDHGLAVKARDAADGKRRSDEASHAEAARDVATWLATL